MLARVLASTFHTLRRMGSLRAGVRYARRWPVVRSLTTSMLNGLLAARGERVWRQTPVGWLKFEPVWEDSYANGEPEPETLPILRSLLNSQTVFYDIGAHIGFYALFAAPVVQQVFAFEPDPDNAAMVHEVVARNALSNVAIAECAICDTDGELSFERSPGLRMSGHIAGVGCDSSDTGERITVPAVTLDTFCRTHPRPDVMKIDTEGAEGAVLRGALEVLRECYPSLLIEVHREDFLAEVESVLRPLGYRLTRLHRPDLPPFPSHYFACIG